MHFRHRLFIQSPLRTKAFSIGSVDSCVPIPHFTLTSSLRWRVLDITYPYEGQQSVQMPFLKLHRDVIRNHPVVNKLRRNRFFITSCLLILDKASSSHRCFDVRIDGGVVFSRQPSIYFGIDILGHTSYIIKNFLIGFFLFSEKCLVPFAFPF